MLLFLQYVLLCEIDAGSIITSGPNASLLTAELTMEFSCSKGTESFSVNCTE